VAGVGQKARAQRGYSLAELLVVLALLGMIAVAMTGGMRFGTRLWERSQSLSEQHDTASGAQSLLRTIFQRIIPRDLDPGIDNDPYLFRATPVSMSFTAVSPAAVDASEVARFELQVSGAPGSRSLNLVWSSLSGKQARHVQNLVTGARDVEFVFASLDQNGNLVWRKDWIDETGAPALIVIRVKGKTGTAESWPELIVRPRISREPTCIYDPVSFGCRHA
jgi:prepilin-type N-terminal cleavage/methylation domain-containing protein